MDIKVKTLWTLVCVIVVTFSISLSAKVSIVRESSYNKTNNLNQENQSKTESTSAVYTGSIKVHVVETISRWRDDSGSPYGNAHLNYAIKAGLNIPNATVWDTTVTWNGTIKGFGDVTSNNIGTAVAVFNDIDVLCDAYPPNAFWFQANYADASAMAHPGSPGMNQTTDVFTHSVFIEEGTATW